MISLRYLKTLDISLADLTLRSADDDEAHLAGNKKVSVSTDTNNIEKGEWLKYSRDTAGLGKKGMRNVNVYTQCDIKIAASHYRAV